MSLLMLMDSLSRNESVHSLWLATYETLKHVISETYALLCLQVLFYVLTSRLSFGTLFSTTGINNYYVWLYVFMLILINSYQAQTISEAGETIWIVFIFNIYWYIQILWIRCIFPLTSTLIFTLSSKTLKYQFIVSVWSKTLPTLLQTVMVEAH